MMFRDQGNKLAEFMEDSYGYYSITRLIFLLINATAVGISLYCTIALQSPRKAVELVGVLLGGSFFGKVAQKQIEERSPNQRRRLDHYEDDEYEEV
jgi:hypothetical protein